MFAKALWNQFRGDLKASWQKTLLLAVLLAVGLFFWIPPLYRAMAGNSSTRNKRYTVAVVTGKGVPSPGNASPSAANSPTSTSYLSWETAEELLMTDPLMQSADTAGLRSKPFQIDTDQFPPPILFADESPESTSQPEKPTGKSSANARSVNSGDTLKQQASREGFILKSTIMGENRRAALINDTLYREGSMIQVDGETYLLAVVHPRQVELRKGESVIVLSLPGASSVEGIRIERADAGDAAP